MKTYEGKRTIDGLVVTVDGKQLDEHYEVKRFTKYGFEWTYEGESPQQLALAILFDYLGDRERAIRLSESFMRDVVANLDNDWTISSEEIDAFLRGSGQSTAKLVVRVGLGAAIHALLRAYEDVDARDKRGHDGECCVTYSNAPH